MGSIKAIFIKQGGWNIIRRYWKGGAFFTAVGEFFLLGHSHTALEILRLSAYMKIRQKLKKKFWNLLNTFEENYDVSLDHVSCNKVWVCWFQGMENAPFIVQRCYHSLKENLTDRDIILITRDNMLDYVHFPNYILDRWKKGQITNTHMTDLLRLELLIKYGGMWIDATVLCTRKREEIPEYYFDSDLFMYQILKPGRDGHVLRHSSWLISAKTNNKILMATQYLCYEYWKKHSEMIDYFLFHILLSIVFEFYPTDCKQMVPMDSSAPHILLLRLFEQYDERLWRAIKVQTPFHKLSYKLEEERMKIEGTYYKKVLLGDKKVDVQV